MVQEITTHSWISRMASALLGILVGILLIIAMFVLIYINESRGLHMAQSLAQTKQVVITVKSAPIEEKNNLKVIYLNGLATTNNILNDALLGIAVKGIRLKRKVEMYQWQQQTETKTEKELGGSEKEITTYTYHHIWADKPINSEAFKDVSGHQNPANMPFESEQHQAQNVTVGDFTLPTNLIDKILNESSVDLAKVNLTVLQQATSLTVHHDGNTLYLGQHSQSPQVGDIRITATQVLPQDVSIIAQQTDHTLKPYLAPAGQMVALLVSGTVSADQMIDDAATENQMLIWILRLVSLVVMIIGVGLILRPLAVFADVVPFFGSLVNMSIWLMASLCGLLLWAMATTIAWFFVRPLWAIGLIVIMLCCVYLIYLHRNKSHFKNTS